MGKRWFRFAAEFRTSTLSCSRTLDTSTHDETSNLRYQEMFSAKPVGAVPSMKICPTSTLHNCWALTVVRCTLLKAVGPWNFWCTKQWWSGWESDGWIGYPIVPSNVTLFEIPFHNLLLLFPKCYLLPLHFCDLNKMVHAGYLVLVIQWTQKCGHVNAIY